MSPALLAALFCAAIPAAAQEPPVVLRSPEKLPTPEISTPTPTGTPWRPAPKPPRKRLRSPAEELEGKDASEIFDGASSESRRGPRIFGVEFGAVEEAQPDKNEPFLSKGLAGLFDWDIRARVSLSGLGGRAKYRHPGQLRGFSVGFLKYADWPGAVGLGPLRKDIYGAVGAVPEIPRGGFELGVSGAVNQYVGGATTLDWKESRKGDTELDRKTLTTGAGYSPLGDNAGKPWNYTLLAVLSYKELSAQEPGSSREWDGFGYAVGAAFQHALHEIPITPPRKAKPGPKGALWFDRFKTSVVMSQSQISSLSFKASAEVSFYLFEHLGLTTGLSATLTPSPDPEYYDEKTMRWDAILGMDLIY